MDGNLIHTDQKMGFILGQGAWRALETGSLAVYVRSPEQMRPSAQRSACYDHFSPSPKGHCRWDSVIAIVLLAMQSPAL